jgi:NAD-dependent DNA ligase
MSDLDRLQEMHAQLRRAKFFYYEKHESIMIDCEFDMLEKKYTKLAEDVGILDKHNMATEFVGFDAISPMNLNNFYMWDSKTNKCVLK